MLYFLLPIPNAVKKELGINIFSEDENDYYHYCGCYDSDLLLFDYHYPIIINITIIT